MFESTIGKSIIGLAILLIAGLQYAYWIGENSYQAHHALLQDIENQKQHNQELRERNRVLAAEVYDLKNGAEAIEEHARLDLGLIKPHETFIQMSMISGKYEPIYLNNIQISAEEEITNETPITEEP